MVVQYDGTDFCGWALQRDVRTVEGTLKKCIQEITGEEPEIRAASRTDSGAHALGQVVDFLTTNPMPAVKWADVLNRILPPDVTIARSGPVMLKFHSRFFARSRVYEYRISERARVEPMRARYVYESGYRLDEEKMAEAGKSLVGVRDFRAFGEKLKGVENTVRRMYSLEVRRVRDEVRIRMEASAFVRGMARRIAGGLFEVGTGRRSVEDFVGLVDKRQRDVLPLPVVLPAKGLVLLRVRYGTRLRDVREEGEPPDWWWEEEGQDEEVRGAETSLEGSV
jgi:tRNA pseudouridine38-40 synthase